MKSLTHSIAFLLLLLPTAMLLGQGKNNKPDVIIKNCSLIDVVKRTVLYKQNILIRNGKIISVSEKLPSAAGSKIIDGSHLIALPGFIDTHTHLWQHIGKSMYPKEFLQDWIKVYRSIYYLDSAELYKVVSAACGEALLSGITTVSDYASLSFNDYGFETNANAIRNSGIGGVLVWNNPGVFLPDTIKIIEIEKFRIQYKNQFSIWMGPGPLSFYSLPQVYSGIRIAQQLRMSITEHTMENMQEQRDLYDLTKKYLAKYGSQLTEMDKTFLESMLQLKRPSNVDAFERLLRDKKRILFLDSNLQSNIKAKLLTDSEKLELATLPSDRHISPLPFFEYFDALKDFLAIHAVWLEEEDIELAKKYNIAISHNPESNEYLTSGVAPVYEYIHGNIPLTIGTDGAASNDGIDMFTAMKAMWDLYKIRLLNVDISKDINPWDIICAATINGAKALHIDSLTGSIEVGKRADIVLISEEELGMAPFRESTIIPLIINSADTRNVKYVLGNGKLLVSNGQLTTSNEHSLANDLTSIANVIDKRIISGKTWSEAYKFKDKNWNHYWFKYRAIRIPDSVNLKVTNQSNDPIKFSIMGSAAVFGGGLPNVVSTDVQKRFPFVQDSSFAKTVLLQPGETISVKKLKSSFNIRLTYKNDVFDNYTKTGQLLLLAERAK